MEDDDGSTDDVALTVVVGRFQDASSWFAFVVLLLLLVVVRGFK